MDALDVRILRAMLPQPHEHWPRRPDAFRPVHVARVVGTTVDTVKARVARMEEDGVIVGYAALPNMSLLGRANCDYWLRVPDESSLDDVLRDVESLDGIVTVHDYIGGGVCVNLTYRGEEDLARVVQAMQKSCGGERVLRFMERNLPPVTRPLSRLDWRILRVLRATPLASHAEVAEAVGVSQRTVRRRYERMAADGAFLIVPLLDPSRASGLFLVDLMFYLEPAETGKAPGRILKAYDDSQVFSYEPSSAELGHFNVIAVARTSAEVDELRLRGAGIPGVARAEAWLFRRFRERGTWIDAAIDEMARSA